MKVRILFAQLVLAALARGAGHQSPDDGFRISVNVHLVTLHATVRDSSGRFVSDLMQKDFEILEDGVRQTVRLFRHEDVPITAGLIVDHSGSMRNKLPDVVAAARVFAQSSSPLDEMFVVNFNERASMGLPAGLPFTNRPDELARAISSSPATGRTALYDAVSTAQIRLESGRHDKKVLIVISDGADNASSNKLAEVLIAARKSPALIYTIGIFDTNDPDRNPGVLKRLAHATGGEAIFPRQTSDAAAGCERIAREIRNQYVLAYVSTNSQPGTYRNLRVSARSAGGRRLVVRTRAGYIAASEPVAK